MVWRGVVSYTRKESKPANEIIFCYLFVSDYCRERNRVKVHFISLFVVVVTRTFTRLVTCCCSLVSFIVFFQLTSLLSNGYSNTSSTTLNRIHIYLYIYKERAHTYAYAPHRTGSRHVHTNRNTFGRAG